MTRASHLLVRLLLLVVVALPSTARGADEMTEAADTFAAAERAYRRGDFRAAAKLFEATNDIAPHGAALYNAAMAWLAAKERARAADAFAAARKAGGLDDRQERTSLAELDELRRELARVAVGAPRGSRVSLQHVDQAPTPVVVHVEPGVYEVKVELPSGEKLRKTVDAVVGTLTTVAFEAPSEPEPVAPPDARQQEGAALPIAGAVVLGTSVVAAAVAIGVGVAALDARDEFNASGYVDRDAHDRAAALRTAANVSWVLAGVAAATGGVMLVLGLQGDDDDEGNQDAAGGPAAVVELRIGPGAVTVGGAW